MRRGLVVAAAMMAPVLGPAAVLTTANANAAVSASATAREAAPAQAGQ